MLRKNTLFSLLLCCCWLLPAQTLSLSDIPEGAPRLHIKKATDPIKLDGVLDEASWSEAERTTEFWQYFPTDTVTATEQSVVRMTYDDQFLYIAVICSSTAGNDWIITSLRRDFRGGNNDGLSFLIDPFANQTNAFFFGLSPFGVRREALISNGGNDRGSFDLSWDNKWYAETQIKDKHWVGEIAIPFKTLRYGKDQKFWRFNSYRLDSQTNERSTWIQIPQNQLIFSLAFSGYLIWDTPPKQPGANIVAIPFIAANGQQDYEEGTDFDSGMEVGGDVKVGITPSLNLDLTFNPDFSQVEVDRQVTNLDRFEIFFPERRQFFLENADLFANFGTNRVRPFFSRRIGVARNEETGVNEQNKINFGARLSGRLNKNWRVGLLNMEAAADADIFRPGYNYTVAALQRQVFKRSNIGVVFVNKQATALDSLVGNIYARTLPNGDESVLGVIRPERFSQEVQDSLVEIGSNSRYNRIVGIDYNLASASNEWTGKTFFHRSFSPVQEDEAFSHGLSLGYNVRDFELTWEHQWVGEGFTAEVGFVPRTGFRRISPAGRYTFYPNGRIVNRHGPTLETDMIWDNTGRQTDHSYILGYTINFQNSARLEFGVGNTYTYLFSSFDPTRTDGIELPEGSDYSYNQFGFGFQSDQRKVLSWRADGLMGEFFNGNLIQLNTDITYRYQPYGTVVLSASYNRIRLPDPYNDADLWLIGPRVDLTLTRKLFLTTFLQYNSQIENFNINARFQWRFKPVSDLFLVYTDNYFTDVFRIRSRALILKLNYWLNL